MTFVIYCISKKVFGRTNVKPKFLHALHFSIYNLSKFMKIIMGIEYSVSNTVLQVVQQVNAKIKDAKIIS